MISSESQGLGILGDARRGRAPGRRWEYGRVRATRGRSERGRKVSRGPAVSVPLAENYKGSPVMSILKKFGRAPDESKIHSRSIKRSYKIQR